jgi:hypothetical protein
MSILKAILMEMLGLFVDDGRFVVSVMAWVLAGVICQRNHFIDSRIVAVLLFLGVALLLVENAGRTARTHRASGPETR